MHNPLIDPTEMYLRTVWELEEEGITPIRARLVERLGLAAPTVSEAVSRLEEEGLLLLDEERRLQLTEEGRQIAVSVMRKHRLAERLLADVIGLSWDKVHAEACRWEHVISDEVEQRLEEFLGSPGSDPHGNPIPGSDGDALPGGSRLHSLLEVAPEEEPVRIDRLSEQLQNDPEMMDVLASHELRPGTVVVPGRIDGGVTIRLDGERVEVSEELARLVYVVPAPAAPT